MSGPTANTRPPVIWAAVRCHRLKQIPMQKNKCVGGDINAQGAPLAYDLLSSEKTDTTKTRRPNGRRSPVQIRRVQPVEGCCAV
jgi:hypothetical protein